MPGGELWYLNKIRELSGRDILDSNIVANHTRGHGWDLGDFSKMGSWSERDLLDIDIKPHDTIHHP